VLEINGHDLGEIDEAFTTAEDGSGGQPTVILAHTIKGRGFSEVENKEGWHGRPFPPDMANRAIAELGGERDLIVRGPLPPGTGPDTEPDEPDTGQGTEPDMPAAADQAHGHPETPPSGPPTYSLGAEVATRKAYGDALVALGGDLPRVVALDGEVSNSTFAMEFAKTYPGRYFEMFIAEQQMVAAAVGLSARHYIPFASTFAAFFSRAYDFIRMAAISQANIRLSGSHAGVEIGPDGPSQMALEDLAMMRAVHGSTVLYPSDATSTAALVTAMAHRQGISYLRTTRGAYPVLYDSEETFPVGGSKVLRSSPDDAVTLIGAGVTLHACLAAADQLAVDGLRARVIDLYSVKPIDTGTLAAAAAATNGRLVVAEDHYAAGGLGSAVADALLEAGAADLRFTHLCVRELPGSGSPQELLAAAGIDAAHIEVAARELIAR
jgi:transketolase